jgi:hypothetical protein
MLEQVSVILPRERWQERSRGVLAARAAAEFPSIFIGYGSDGETVSPPHLSSSQWRRPDFDSWRFDVDVDELAREPFTLRIADDDDAEPSPFALEVLNRCQRHIGRRNQHSQGQLFDRVLRRHRALHDVEKPLVRADFNHALDVWQWVLRLDGAASLPLQLAALFHDVERLVSEADVRVEHLAGDYQAFKDAHARAGAAMTRTVLAECGVAEKISERVADLVARHERPSPDPELALLNDADALSFFSLNASGYADYFGPEQTMKKVAYTWRRLRPQSRPKLATVYLRPDIREMVTAQG